MIVRETIEGEVILNFKCGCKTKIIWYFSNDMIFSEPEVDITAENYQLCEKHQKYIYNIDESYYGTILNWEDIMDKIYEEFEDPDWNRGYSDFFETYDELDVPYSLDYFIDKRINNITTPKVSNLS